MIGRPRALAQARARFWQCHSAGATIIAAACEAAVATSTAQRWIVESGGVRPRRTPPPSSRYLSLKEREKNSELNQAGHNQRQIAHAVGRSPNTISRELRAGTNARGYYITSTVHRASLDRARRLQAAKLATCERLRDFVQMSTIPEHWTISGPAKLTHLRQRWEGDFIGGLGGDPPVASQ